MSKTAFGDSAYNAYNELPQYFHAHNEILKVAEKLYVIDG